MGDFFGGMLNPFFSILGLAMLLVTLFQNQKELELSRKELKDSSMALVAQASTLDKQRFEDTFFSLLGQQNHSLDKILSEGVYYDFDGKPSKASSRVKSLKNELIGGEAYPIMPFCSELKIAKSRLLKHDPLLNQYFRILYQILKLIATSSPGSTLENGFVIAELESTIPSDKEKFYSNIVRSFIPEDVYYLLAINCFCDGVNDPFYPYKLLIERYALLEHMPLTLPKHQNHALINEMMTHYSYAAFGNNSGYVTVS